MLVNTAAQCLGFENDLNENILPALINLKSTTTQELKLHFKYTFDFTLS